MNTENTENRDSTNEPSDTIGCPTEQRAAEILKKCSDTLPNSIIALLLGVDEKSLAKRRRKLGMKINPVGVKKLIYEFLQTPPDLSDLPLTFAERKFVMLQRRDWIEHRGKGQQWLEHVRTLIEELSHKLPTVGIAAIVQMSDNWVRRQQQQLGLEIERAEFTKLRHRFAKSLSCPNYPGLSPEERIRLSESWKKAHQVELNAKEKRAKKSEEFAEKLLVSLRQSRDSANQPLHPCSGSCGECWPRTKTYFIPNFRSADKLGDRCKYCTYLTRAKARAEGRFGKRNRGRIPSAAEYLRLCEIVAKYWRIIPAPLLRPLFQISDGTLCRIRHEVKIEFSAAESKTIYWRYFFRTPPLDLPLLTEGELARLHLLSMRWREKMGKRFERDKAREQQLRIVAYAIVKEHGTAEPPLETKRCRCCKSELPDLSQFFRTCGGKTESICRICVSYHQRRKLWAKLKRRFSS